VKKQSLIILVKNLITNLLLVDWNDAKSLLDAGPDFSRLDQANTLSRESYPEKGISSR